MPRRSICKFGMFSRSVCNIFQERLAASSCSSLYISPLPCTSFHTFHCHFLSFLFSSFLEQQQLLLHSKTQQKMVAIETTQATPMSIDPPSSPRISFSAEFLDEKNFISINPKPHLVEKDREAQVDLERSRNATDFEFLSNNSHTMLTADELFFKGKMLPFWQVQHCDQKLNRINLKTKDSSSPDVDHHDDHQQQRQRQAQDQEMVSKMEEPRVTSWFVDDDPSPRPPKCTVLWKELLRLKKQRATSTLSLSASTSSSSSRSSSSSTSLSDGVAAEEGKKSSSDSKEKQVKRVKKGLERTRSSSIRIRPMINVPICTQVKSSSLPPLFPLKKGRVER